MFIFLYYIGCILGAYWFHIACTIIVYWVYIWNIDCTFAAHLGAHSMYIKIYYVYWMHIGVHLGSSECILQVFVASWIHIGCTFIVYMGAYWTCIRFML